MRNEHMQTNVAETEKTLENTVEFVGRLNDLSIGNPDGIPSEYAEYNDDQLQEVAERLAERLVEPTDLSAAARIDGRRTKQNMDGSAPEVRLRRVGGSASNFGVALNANASVINTLSQEDSLGQEIEQVDAYISEHTGFERSAHAGGCGGANGEVSDNEAIHSNPVILSATKSFMEISAVKEYLGAGYNDELEESVRENAGLTAEYLRANNWEGQKYVDGVIQDNPRGVEDLEVDHEDEKFHGHKEKTLTIIIGDKTLDANDEFVWNLKASRQVAEALAGQRGGEGYQQALMAEVAKHIAVAHRLASDKTPVVLLRAA